MTEQFIIHYAAERIRQLGHKKYHLDYVDLVLDGLNEMTIEAYNELLFIIDDPEGLVIESDYGIYDSTSTPVADNVHQHRGLIIVRNPGDEKRRIKFIRIIIVN